MNDLVRYSQKSVVKSSDRTLARKAVGGGVAAAGAAALAVPFVAALIPFVSAGMLAVLMVIAGLFLTFK